MKPASAFLKGVQIPLHDMQESKKLGQLTREQAIELAESGIWKEWTDEEIVKLQLYQDCLCMDFSRFHEAVESVLGRSVRTHEFAFADGLREEYEGKRGKPSFAAFTRGITASRMALLTFSLTTSGSLSPANPVWYFCTSF